MAADVQEKLISRQYSRRAVRRVLTVAVVLLAVAAFVIGTPFALLGLGNLRHADWIQFSNEGQAYGGIAAVFGMLALVGVVISVILQSRDTATNRALAQRTVHSDLWSKALDDPELLACWGPSIYGDLKYDRQHAYINLIFSFWRKWFELGFLPEEELRASSAYMFAAAPGRRYWSIAGSFQKMFYTADLDIRFTMIVNEEYDKAVVTPITEPPEGKVPPTLIRGRSTIGALALGFTGGAILAGVLTGIRRGYISLAQRSK